MAIEESLHFWGKKTDEKCWFYGRMSWVSFAHTTKASFTLWMCFPLTKEARQTDPHSWHLESGKTKLYKIGWIIFCKRMVAFMFTKKILFQNCHIYTTIGIHRSTFDLEIVSITAKPYTVMWTVYRFYSAKLCFFFLQPLAMKYKTTAYGKQLL